MFTRSNWGLSNRARFTGTSYTVYVEGGGGNAGQGSDDVLFWKAVFAKLRPDLAITLKPLGGKPLLEAMAQKVAAGSVHSTIVAMDADFDELLGEKIVSPKVIYSYGYSWENDALTFVTIEAALERLLKLDHLPDQISASVSLAYKKCLNALVKYINADFYLRLLNKSLFPNVSNGNFIKQTIGTAEPSIDLAPLRKCVVHTLASVPRAKKVACKPNVSILDPQGFVQGHTLMFLVRKVLTYGAKLVGRSITVNEELLVQTVIPAFSDHGLVHDRLLRAHYVRILGAL